MVSTRNSSKSSPLPSAQKAKVSTKKIAKGNKSSPLPSAQKAKVSTKKAAKENASSPLPSAQKAKVPTKKIAKENLIPKEPKKLADFLTFVRSSLRGLYPKEICAYKEGRRDYVVTLTDENGNETEFHFNQRRTNVELCIDIDPCCAIVKGKSIEMMCTFIDAAAKKIKSYPSFRIDDLEIKEIKQIMLQCSRRFGAISMRLFGVYPGEDELTDLIRNTKFGEVNEFYFHAKQQLNYDLLPVVVHKQRFIRLNTESFPCLPESLNILLKKWVAREVSVMELELRSIYLGGEELAVIAKDEDILKDVDCQVFGDEKDRELVGDSYMGNRTAAITRDILVRRNITEYKLAELKIRTEVELPEKYNDKKVLDDWLNYGHNLDESPDLYCMATQYVKFEVQTPAVRHI